LRYDDRRDNDYGGRRSGGGDRYNRRDDNYGRRGGGRRDYDRGYDRRDNSRRDRRDDYDRRDRRRGRYRSRSRTPTPDPIHVPLDAFRPRDLSRERPEGTFGEEERIGLEEKEVAYVFGRMGTTKDKLARVSGSNIELHGQDLVLQGDRDSIERARKYVRILLDQRHGDVLVDPKDHENDLTLVDVPTDCKGFITGKGGATLRQIERECATLMTFCRNEGGDGGNREPLAIFGTRRGRLTAELKVMSVVEGKHKNWFVPADGGPPTVKFSESDLDLGGDWGFDSLELQQSSLGYALGQKGNTRIKLQCASGCIIQYVGMWALLGGTALEQKRGKNYLTWLLNQRNSDFSVETGGRADVTVIYVPEPSVGYVTGKKAKTLRNLEQKSGTFCFFDKRGGGTGRSRSRKEKMLIFSHSKENRERAVEEVQMIVNFHQNKTRAFDKVTFESSASKSNSRSRSKSGSRSGSRSPSRSRSKSRKSYTRSRSRGGSRETAGSKDRDVKEEN